jgi:choline-sulfatase
LFNNAMFLQTLNDNLALKPSCQLSNKQAYRQYISGIVNVPKYLRYYYTLQQRADEQMLKVYQALQRSRFYEDTIVIFTSDHGDYLSSHNNLHQKWYGAYEEVTKVPCIISNPKMFPRPQTVDAATNHIDIMPTMLGLAGIDPEPIRLQLSQSFTEAERLVGRNLANLVTGRVSSSSVKEPTFFMTDDDMSRGSNQINWIGYPYNSVVQPNHIETVFVWLEGAYWKYSRYFDAPQFWSAAGDPSQGCGKDNVVGQVTANKPAGTYTVPVQQTLKDQPIPTQFEMYNVTEDPMELNNLAGNPRFARQQKVLADMLFAESCAKRLQPAYAPPPGAERCA